MRDEVVRIELDRLVHEAAASSNLPQMKYDSPIAAVGLGQVAVVHQRLEAELLRLFAEIVLAREKYWYIWPYALEHAAYAAA